jgi:hypothetical protein
VPPPSYGGIEQVVATLATGLVERGHDVVLVAAPGWVLPGAELVSPLASLPAVIGEPAADWRHALAGMDALADCDVVIDHSGPRPPSTSSGHKRPCTPSQSGPGVRATSRSTSHVDLNYESGREAIRQAPEVEETIYRVVQEALSNVIKHAEG